MVIVLTVDQVGSRHSDDRVPEILERTDALRAQGALLGPDRTAGDEFQLLLADPAAAVRVVLDLARTGVWTVGVGVGAVRTPLPATTREATGPAFSSARAAVEQAKRDPHRVVVRSETDPLGAADLTALLHLLLETRARRTPEGWVVADLLADGSTQAAIAQREGITPQAASLRARAAGVRADLAAVPALTRLLAALDRHPSTDVPPSP